MFKVAKTFQVINENVDVNVIVCEIGHVNSENGKIEHYKQDELEFNISGNINDDDYCMHFIITKPVSEYFKIKKYEKEKIKLNEITDSYININDTVYFDPVIELEVLRFSEEFIFSFIFRDYDNQFFGSAEFSVGIEKLKTDNRFKKENCCE